VSVLHFKVNGREMRVRDVDPHTTLLAFLRGLGLTGAKEGCAEGECGSCVVAFVRAASPSRAQYEAVNACLVLLPAVDGAEILTVEALEQGRALHPVQEAIVREGGSQCGYCTPGFVMSLFAHYYTSPRPSVERALSGNLCRCTGYRPLRDAGRSLPQVAADDAFASRLAQPAPVQASIDYAAAGVSFARPAQLAEALALRAAQPDATIVCGGTDVVVAINQHGLRAQRFIAIDQVEELSHVRVEGEQLVIGACAPLTLLERELVPRSPLFAQLLPLCASLPVRARASLGGNLVTASPIGDAAPVLLALDAELELMSARGSRRLPIYDFFTGYRATDLAPDELLAFIRVPRVEPAHARFYKVARRSLDDISCVSAAFVLALDDEGVVQRARLAYGGVAETPKRAYAAEDALVGQPLGRGLSALATPLLDVSFTPIDDVRGSASYRRLLVSTLFERFVEEVCP
jgi:xanthine dehydrogenase small subunit